MKVIFLDFDGVLNSEGSFRYEDRRRNEWKLQGVKGNVGETLCNVCTSNFQMILDRYKDVKVVISSSWRHFFSLEEILAKLEEYHVSSNRVIGITPTNKGDNRGIEINMWLADHPEVTQYVIIDDNDWGIFGLHAKENIISTTWEAGLTYDKALEVIQKLKTPKRDER